MTAILCSILSLFVGAGLIVVLAPTVVLSKLSEMLGKTLKWLSKKAEFNRRGNVGEE